MSGSQTQMYREASSLVVREKPAGPTNRRRRRCSLNDSGADWTVASGLAYEDPELHCDEPERRDHEVRANPRSKSPEAADAAPPATVSDPAGATTTHTSAARRRTPHPTTRFIPHPLESRPTKGRLSPSSPLALANSSTRIVELLSYRGRCLARPKPEPLRPQATLRLRSSTGRVELTLSPRYGR